MRKLPFIILLVLIVFAGLNCGKDTPDPVFVSYLKFTLDGVAVTCNADIRASAALPYGSAHSISISGGWNGGSISLSLYDDMPLISKQYIFQSDKSRRGTLWVNIGPGLTRLYYAGDNGFANTLSGSGQITITEINEAFVKGTFALVSGVEMPSNTFITVTGGEFHIRRY